MSFRWANYRYRLISLLELMQEIKVGGLFDIGVILGRGRDKFLAALELPDADEYVRGPEFKREFRKHLAGLSVIVDHADLSFTKAALKKLSGRAKLRTTYARDILVEYGQIPDTIGTELSMRRFFALELSSVQFYENPFDGWETVGDSFPSTVEDIFEAGRCFALDRYTASVFHLMRVAEVAVRSIAKAIGSKNPKPEWGALLSEIEAALAKKHKHLPPKIRANLPLVKGICAHMRAVNMAWRRPTMHMESKYSPEQAKDIYGAIGGLMRHIAGSLKETG